MFELFKKDDEEKFTWADIGDIEDGRRNLGKNMPVFVYRLFQYTIKDEIMKVYGKEKVIDIFRNAGELAGVEFANHLLNLDVELNEFVSHLQEVLEESKIGILRIESYNEETGRVVLTIGEDLDCSGLPVTGETVCYYDEGFLAGILKVYTNKNYTVKEIDCWATSARVCRFEGKVIDGE